MVFRVKCEFIFTIHFGLGQHKHIFYQSVSNAKRWEANLVVVAYFEACLCSGSNKNVAEDKPILILAEDSTLLQL